MAQLKSPGRMFIPVGTLNQAIVQVVKDENGKVTTKELFDVMVRLTFDDPPDRSNNASANTVCPADRPQAVTGHVGRGIQRAVRTF